MSLTEINFLIFLVLAVTGYYIVPKRIQWVWLLAFSYIYYAFNNIKILFFLLFTTVTTFVAGVVLEKININIQDKKQCKFYKKLTLLGGLVLNFGMLAFLKYANFAIENVNSLFGTQIGVMQLILPLGISFYTFQSMGYLMDVYWGKFSCEKNLAKFALFVSFFPQLLQGPIGRFNRLATQLYDTHSFSLLKIEHGLQLIIWGYFKKMVIADRAAVIVNKIFDNYTQYNGVFFVMAVLFYSIQLYGDFSGGMDVVMGISELFGIQLDQNFKRPFFARSITDFWHRWHITLGTWMKDYVFYPISLSKWMNKLGKFAKKIFGKQIGRVLPICIANLLVFIIVGVWHGAAWKFIVYGLYNGVIIAFSGLAAPLYAKALARFHIKPNGKAWHLWQIIRTFILVNISWYFDRASGLSTALVMMKNTFVGFSLTPLFDKSFLSLGLTKTDFAILLVACCVWFVVSLLQENKVEIRNSLDKLVLPLRWIVYLTLTLSIPLFGMFGVASTFIYAQF